MPARLQAAIDMGLISVAGGTAIVYTIITVKVNRQAAQWQGTYRPEIEEDKALLKKHVQPLR